MRLLQTISLSRNYCSVRIKINISFFDLFSIKLIFFCFFFNQLYFVVTVILEIIFKSIYYTYCLLLVITHCHYQYVTVYFTVKIFYKTLYYNVLFFKLYEF